VVPDFDAGLDPFSRRKSGRYAAMTTFAGFDLWPGAGEPRPRMSVAAEEQLSGRAWCG